MTVTGKVSRRLRNAALAIVSAGMATTAGAHGDGDARIVAQAGEALGVMPVVSASLRGQWALHDGVTALRFNLDLLEDLGIALEDVDASAETANPRYLGFAMETPARLGFDAVGGALESLRSASIPHRGGALLALAAERVSMQAFVLRTGSEPGHLELVGPEREALFTLSRAHTYRDAGSAELFVMQMDLKLAAPLAGRLGTPEFAGLIVGTADLTARVAPLSKDAGLGPPLGECVADFGDDSVDVGLLDLDDISQLAREPGRVAFAPSAKLRNVGNNDIRWYWAIEPLGFNGPNLGSHPYLAMHYYRIDAGVIEQIGRSELKHAWNTVNSNCGCAGGQVMFIGCEDTYGVSNNGTQFYFSPREELTAHSGAWQSLGSHFDAEPVDDFRDHGDEPSAHDAFEHRLVVDEADLDIPGAEYYVEAWYVVAGDVDIFNSMGHRAVTQTLLGSTWIFNFTALTALGPAVDAWVDPQTIVPGESNRTLASADGHLKLAARASDLGDGRYHYEYAIMNLDLDRQVRAFSVPLAVGVNVSDVGFGDVDGDAGNDWTVSVGARAIEFSAVAGNALDWGTLFNFRFDADAEPADAGVLLEPLESGDASYLALVAPAPVGNGGGLDSDADGIPDSGDNCTLMPNADQRDTDGDRYGNACDADLSNDGRVNFADLAALKSVFLENGDLDADLDGDGVVSFSDLAAMKSAFFLVPGPSGLTP